MKKHMSFLFLLLSMPTLLLAQEGSLDSSFSNPTHLSDSEMQNANEFVHQGVKERVYQEGCAKANGCRDDQSGFPLEEMIGKAYALLGTLSGSTLTSKPKASAGTETPAPAAGEKGAKAEKETQPDYCMMVATGYEAFGGMIQNALQKKADQSAAASGDIQLQSLVNLKETHKARQKTAAIQRGIYAGVTACYGAMIASGQIQADWKFYAKIGGAAALTGLYWKKVEKHKNAAKDVQAVISSLPKAGKGCDPWINTKCFCSEITSKETYPNEYQEVCVLNNGDFETPKVALGCAAVNGNKMSYDKDCKCKQTNSCLKSNFKFNSNIGLGNNLMQEANKVFGTISGGEFDLAKIDHASTSASSMAAKIKLKNPPKGPKKSLTAEQKKMAESLKEFMPEALANSAAGSNSSYTGGIKESSMGQSAISKLTPAIKEKLAEAINMKYKKGSDNTNSLADEPGFTMPPLPGQEETQQGSEILTFAEQAVSKADVSNAPETPIFDIISNRYRRSGWTKLDTEGK